MKINATHVIKISAAIWIAALAGACANNAPGENINLQSSVDAYFQPLVEGREFSGIVIVAEGNDILVSKAYGMADFEAGSPHKLNSSFAIASLSKTFTAAAIELLEKRNTLCLEDNLSKYIPTFPRGEEITLKMLLLHQSGVAEAHHIPGYMEDRLKPVSLAQFVEKIGAQPLNFEPGSDGAYSNSGYIILARVVEVVSGNDFDNFLEQELLGPAGLSDTAINWTDEAITPGYFPGLPPTLVERKERDTHPSHNLGASELRSTGGDLVDWLRAVDDGGQFDITALDYPYGWGVREYYGRPAIEQSGITGGFISAMALFPEDDLYIVVLSNIRAGRPQARAHIDLAGMAFGEKIEPLQQHQILLGGKEDLTQYAGRYDFPGVGPIVIRDTGSVLEFEWEGFDLSSYLYPLGDGKFWNKLDGAMIGFEADETGQAAALIWSPDAERTTAPRIAP